MSLTRVLSRTSLFAFSIIGATALVVRPAQADPKSECIEANTRAQNLRHADKLVEARTQLLVCAREVCPGPVRSDCTRWLAEVDDSLPTVVLGAKDREGNDLVQVRVSVDGKVVSQSIDGRALPIDPGAHRFRFEEKGEPPVTRQVVIRQGQKNRAVDVTIGTAAEPAPALAVSQPARRGPTPTPASSPAHDQPRAESPSPGSTQRILALVAGGAGVVGAGVGTVFALESQSKWNDAKTACGTGCGPGSRAYALNDQSRRAGTVAVVSFVAGGVLLATGAVLWLTAPSKDRTASVGAVLGPRSVGVVGTF